MPNVAPVLRARVERYYGPNDATRWWFWPHPQFNGKSPKEMIEAGKGDEVAAYIDVAMP